jgi:hypothetical protein
MVQSGLTSGLRSKPNAVYEVTQLKAIICKAKKGAPFILPELILETKSGRKQKFGVRHAHRRCRRVVCFASGGVYPRWSANFPKISGRASV